jgi:hypothetical protein
MDEVRTVKPATIGQILAGAFELYKRQWATLIAIAAVVTVPLTLLQHYLAHVIRVETPTQAEIETRGIEATSPTLWRALAASAIVGIVSIFIVQVVIGAITRAAAAAPLGDRLGMEEAYRYGYAKLWSVLLVSLLVGLAVTGGFILLVIPGFIVLTRLIVSVPALVVEGKRGRSALSRSWYLTKGYGWRVFGMILLVGLITGGASAILAIPFGQGWLGQAIAAAVGSAITMPYSALALTLVYFDLRARKEEPEFEVIRREFDAAGVATN